MYTFATVFVPAVMCDKFMIHESAIGRVMVCNHILQKGHQK